MKQVYEKTRMRRKLSKRGQRAVVIALSVSLILIGTSIAFTRSPKPVDSIDAKYIEEYEKGWMRQQDWVAIKKKCAEIIIRHTCEGIGDEIEENYILPIKEISIPPGHSEERWEGTLVKCIPSEQPMAWECGICYNYTLELDDGPTILFNDQDFANLNELVNKKVVLVGYKKEIVVIMCPKAVVATKIIVKRV